MEETCLQRQVDKQYKFLIFIRIKLILKKFIKDMRVKLVQFLGIKMIQD